MSEVRTRSSSKLRAMAVTATPLEARALYEAADRLETIAAMPKPATARVGAAGRQVPFILTALCTGTVVLALDKCGVSWWLTLLALWVVPQVAFPLWAHGASQRGAYDA